LRPGSVVTKDVTDFSLVAGVPARHIRWVGKVGVPLEHDGGNAWRCPQTGVRVIEADGLLREDGRN
jgi:UDP-2-acetamido-3-amino-2,3-dideoxy-glucuronate N-acetyltransferase